MKKILIKQFDGLKSKFQPQINQLKNKWSQLQEREKLLVAIMVACLGFTIVYFSVDAIVRYKKSLRSQVVSLNEFVLYANQSADSFKYLSKLEAKSITTPSLEQIKSDVTQVTAIENPGVNLQDGQLCITIQELQFNQAMALLDQLRRSYGLFPSQLTMNRQAKDGYVSFSAMFWVN